MKLQERGIGKTHGLFRRRLKLLTIVCITVIVAPTLFSMFNLQYHFFVIVSDSMNPTLKLGDIAFIQSMNGELANGVVIIFESSFGGFQAHRIVDRVNNEHGVYYITRGDANGYTDSFLVPEENVIGTVSFVLPIVGRYFLIPREIGLIITIALILCYLELTFHAYKTSEERRIVETAVPT